MPELRTGQQLPVVLHRLRQPDAERRSRFPAEPVSGARGVQSCTITKAGIVHAFDANGRLIVQQQAHHSAQWVSSTLDTSVRSFAMTTDGVVYDLNNRNELNCFISSANRFVRIRTGVLSLEQADEGAIDILTEGRASLPVAFEQRRPVKAVLRGIVCGTCPRHRGFKACIPLKRCTSTSGTCRIGGRRGRPAS